MIFSSEDSSWSEKDSIVVCVFGICSMQNNKIHASNGIAMTQNNSAIKRFPASPESAVKADMINATIKIAIAIRVRIAIICFNLFFIIVYPPFCESV